MGSLVCSFQGFRTERNLLLCFFPISFLSFRAFGSLPSRKVQSSEGYLVQGAKSNSSGRLRSKHLNEAAARPSDTQLMGKNLRGGVARRRLLHVLDLEREQQQEMVRQARLSKKRQSWAADEEVSVHTCTDLDWQTWTCRRGVQAAGQRGAQAARTTELPKLSEDVLSLIGEWLPARSIAALNAACSQLHMAQGRMIAGRVRHWWRRLYRSCDAFYEARAVRHLRLTDLARTEAQIQTPFGACVCCLRDGPKFGAMCVDCVANEEESFAGGVPPQAIASATKCASSHVGMVFTCVLCESSSCLRCLCNDTACSMCRLAVDTDL